MPSYTIGARAHDYGKQEPETLFQAVSLNHWVGIQQAFKKAIAGVSGYDDVTPELVQRVKQSLKEKNLEIPVL